MSKFDQHHSQATGYFLPKESQHRLKKLRDYVEFLSHLAPPRTTDEGSERAPEIHARKLATCLELLGEQLRLVLDDIAWPARRDEGEATRSSDPERAMETVPYDAGGRYVFGVTLEQVDTLHRLVDMISAHGDVVAASRGAELAGPTLPALGQAIFDDASTVREIIRQVEAQRLGHPRGSQTGVGEERAVYQAVPACTVRKRRREPKLALLKVGAPWSTPMPRLRCTA